MDKTPVFWQSIVNSICARKSTRGRSDNVLAPAANSGLPQRNGLRN
jgi:hypothetical protein